MGAPCKLRSSRLGEGTQQTSVLLKPHSITVRGATAKRDSASTPKRWKPRRPHNVWRSSYAPMVVRRAGSGDASRDAGTIGATGYAKRVSGETRCKRQRAETESVRRAGWTSRLVVESGAHVFTRCEESLDRPAPGRLLLREAAERRRSRTSARRLHCAGRHFAAFRRPGSAAVIWPCRELDVEADRRWRQHPRSTLI